MSELGDHAVRRMWHAMDYYYMDTVEDSVEEMDALTSLGDCTEAVKAVYGGMFAAAVHEVYVSGLPH